MKKILVWVLLLSLCLGLFAGCTAKEVEPDTTEKVSDTQPENSKASAVNALAYLKKDPNTANKT